MPCLSHTNGKCRAVFEAILDVFLAYYVNVCLDILYIIFMYVYNIYIQGSNIALNIDIEGFGNYCVGIK